MLLSNVSDLWSVLNEFLQANMAQMEVEAYVPDMNTNLGTSFSKVRLSICAKKDWITNYGKVIDACAGMLTNGSGNSTRLQESQETKTRHRQKVDEVFTQNDSIISALPVCTDDCEAKKEEVFDIMMALKEKGLQAITEYEQARNAADRPRNKDDDDDDRAR